MGILFIRVKEETTMIKIAIVVCLVAFAVAEPEADAQYGYGRLGYGYGLGLGYSNYGYSAYGYAPRAYTGYYNRPVYTSRYYGKRSADAEPEADAYYGYNNLAYGYNNYGYNYAPLRYSGAYGYAAPATGAAITVRGYGTPATVGSYAPYGYAASGRYVADSFGAVHIAKREAEAEPEADAYYGYNNFGYNTYSYAPSVISRPVYSSYSSYGSPIYSR